MGFGPNAFGWPQFASFQADATTTTSTSSSTSTSTSSTSSSTSTSTTLPYDARIKAKIAQRRHL